MFNAARHYQPPAAYVTADMMVPFAIHDAARIAYAGERDKKAGYAASYILRTPAGRVIRTMNKPERDAYDSAYGAAKLRAGFQFVDV